MIRRWFRSCALRLARPQARGIVVGAALLWLAPCLTVLATPAVADEAGPPPAPVVLAATAGSAVEMPVATSGVALGFGHTEHVAATVLAEQRGGMSGGVAVPLLPAGSTPAVILWDELKSGQRQSGPSPGDTHNVVRITILPQ